MLFSAYHPQWNSEEEQRLRKLRDSLRAWGIRKKETAAELGISGLREQQGKCMKEERRFGGEREWRRQRPIGTLENKAVIIKRECS